jgi:hypothetical protein
MMLFVASCHGQGLTSDLGPGKELRAGIVPHLSSFKRKFERKGNLKWGDTVTLSGASVSGETIAALARVATREGNRPLHIRNVLINGNVNLSDREFTSAITFSNCSIKGSINLERCRFDAALSLRNCSLNGFYLTASVLSTDLYLSNSRIVDLYLEHVRVSGSIIADRGTFGRTLLSFARCGEMVDFYQARASEFHAPGLSVGGQLVLAGASFTGNVNLFQCKVGKRVFLDRIRTQHKVDLRSCDVDGGVSAVGAHLGNLTLNFANLRGPLQFGTHTVTGRRTTWESAGLLEMRNARITTLAGPLNQFPSRIEFDGCHFESLGVWGPSREQGIESETAVGYKNWLTRQTRYSAQPYARLASVLRERGRYSEASEVAYASSERARETSTGLRRIYLTLDWLLVGHGERVYYCLYWIILIVPVGAFVITHSDAGKRAGLRYGIAYSIDMLLPVFKLRQSHYDIDIEDSARYYFYFHKALGFLLATLLVTTVARLISKGQV